MTKRLLLFLLFKLESVSVCSQFDFGRVAQQSWLHEVSKSKVALAVFCISFTTFTGQSPRQFSRIVPVHAMFFSVIRLYILLLVRSAWLYYLLFCVTVAACFGGGVSHVAGNFLFFLVSNDSDVERTGDVFARCLKTLLKLHFCYCRQVLSQQQTRLEQ